MTAQQPTRVLILGGGFGGLSAARHFEDALPADGSVEVILVSGDNYLLYTPMLAEAATGKVNPVHIAVPLRAFLRRVRVRQSVVTAIDLERRTVSLSFLGTDDTYALQYDHLILALGSVTSFHHAPGSETYAIPFKHLGDAASIRDQVLDCFEQATFEDDPAKRRALLTFVVAGGGFSGVELAAALADFLRETRKFFPRLAGDKLHLVLAHHGHRLLEELSESSAAYTLGLLQRQGIAVRLGTAVSRVTADTVELDPGGTLPTRSVFWTAGVMPNPLVQGLPLVKESHGAVVVDGHLAVQGRRGVWAIGDCASVPNPHDGGTYAPLAQNAEQEGPVVAHNVLASLRGEPLRTFDYRLRGTFASLGERTAVGQVFGLQFSGLAAWFLWRSAYLALLPGWDRKVRVGTDWLLDVALPPDMVAFHIGEALRRGMIARHPASPSGPAKAPPTPTILGGPDAAPTPSPRGPGGATHSSGGVAEGPVASTPPVTGGPAGAAPPPSA